MLIHDDMFTWEGWGGKLKLGSGSCSLRIFDLRKDDEKRLAYLKPIIVVVTDLPESRMSVKSCAGHIATHVVREFLIDPHRMLWVEYYPEKSYGVGGTHVIRERFESVEFTWREDLAIHPKWRELNPTMLDLVRELMKQHGG